MYRIVCSDGTVLYDQSNVNSAYYMLEAKCTREVGQPGALNFTIVPGSNGYNSLESMVTYLSAYEDDEEIFYGRIIDISVEKTTGQTQVQCAGALNFLDDVEVAPFSQAQNMTCREFLEYCINAYNTEIGNDSKRTITIGTVDHSMASTTRSFQVSSYTKVRSALDTYLIKDFGGFVRVRKSGNSHVLDWIEDYDEPNTSPIELQNNVISQDNSITANDLYTVLRPTGKNGITLTEGTVVLSNDLVTKYGRIVRNVSFNNAETESDLRAEVTDYIAKIGKGTGKTATVNVLDLHFLDNTVQRLRLGAVYSNIAGFENELMMIASYEQNFMSPADDSITLKNERELSSAKNGSASGRGSFSKTSDGVFRNIYKHIIETEDSLTIQAKEIALHGERIEETAAEFERYATETTADIITLTGNIRTIQGTGVFQNSDHIVQVAGNYVKRYRVVTAAEKTAGRNPSLAGWYLWSSTPHVVVEEDIGSGIELYNQLSDALTTGRTVNTSIISVGEQYGFMYKTSHTQVDAGTTYYTRTLGAIAGTEVLLVDDGQEVNVVKELKDYGQFKQTVEGSALWVKQDDITGFVGEFDIEVDGQGNRKLVCKAGGGMAIKRSNVEYGIYDSGNLTGGIIVDKVNENTTTTKILGDRVNITASQMAVLGIYTDSHYDAGFLVRRINEQDTSGTYAQITGTFVNIQANQVRVGSTSNVQAWMNTTDQDITTLEGLVADKATIAQLNTQTARIDNIAADYINSTNLYASIGALNSVSVKNLTSERGGINVYTTTTTSLSLGGSDPFTNCIKSASVDQATNTLTLTPAYGNPITFSKAITPTLSGSWSSGVFTVASNPSASNSLVTSLSGSGHWGVAANSEDVNTYYLSILGAVNSGTPSATGYTRNIDASGRYDAGYSSGHTDGVNSVDIYSISQQAEASYSSSTGNYSVGVTATASNGVSDTDTIIFSGYRAYNAGWSGCYGTIEIDPSTATTLGYGGSVTVKAKAKASSSDTSKTEVATVTVTAPAAPTLSGSWNSGVFTVGTSPSIGSLTTSLSGSGHWGVAANSEDVNTYYLSILGAIGSGTPSATGYTRNIDASGRYDAGWNSGFADGAPTGATLGTKVTGTTWNVNIARGSYSAVGKTINLSSAYTDARSGYYTKAQYDANYTSGWSGCYGTVGISPNTKQNLGYGGSVKIYAQAKASSGASSKTNVASVEVTAPANNWQNGFDAGAPTGATLGTKVTGTTWNVNIARGSYSPVGKTINLSSAYTDARSGYYTKAQYDANYDAGYKAGWNGYRINLMDNSHSKGATTVCIYSDWYDTLYVTPYGSQPKYNCATGATSFTIPAARI